MVFDLRCHRRSGVVVPSPKRWFPLSRDLNNDPDVWELTDKFGDRSLRTWLEVLAILDRVDNSWRLSGHWLAGLSRTTRQLPASIRRQLGWMVAKGWLTVAETLPDGSPAVYSATNYAKYHRTRESNGTKIVPASGARSAPSLPYPNRTEPSSYQKVDVKTVDSGDRGVSMKGMHNGIESIGSTVRALLEKDSIDRNPHLSEVEGT